MMSFYILQRLGKVQENVTIIDLTN